MYWVCFLKLHIGLISFPVEEQQGVSAAADPVARVDPPAADLAEPPAAVPAEPPAAVPVEPPAANPVEAPAADPVEPPGKLLNLY